MQTQTKTIGFLKFFLLFFFLFPLRVFALDYGTTSLVGGNGSSGYIGDGVIISGTSQFYNPQGIALADSGVYYIADTNNHCIRKVDGSGILSTLAGSCGNATYAEGTGTGARFYSPNGLTIDKTNQVLYVADQNNQRIRKIDLVTKVTSLVAGSTSGYVEGTGATAQFSSPSRLALDSVNQVLYVSDTGNYKVRKINLANNTTSLIAGSTNGNADGIGSSVQFSSIYGLGLDQTNQILYAADYNNHKIRKIDLTSKNVSTFGPQIIYIYGLTFDATNNLLYYTQSYGGSYTSVGKVDIKTQLSTLVAGGTYGYVEGITSAARFYGAHDLVVDTSNNQLFITDYDNHRIRKVDINHYKTPSFVSAYQYATDTAGSAIVAGGTTNINDVRFNFTFKDDDTFDTDKIEIEIKPVGQAFDGTSNLVYSRNDTVTGTNYTKDIFIGDPILNYNTSYHWQYRITDLANFTSGWASFGGNTESAADFSISAPENSKTTSWYSNTTENNTPQSVLYTTGGIYVAYDYCVRKFPVGYSKELLSGDNSGTLVAGDCKTGGYIEGTAEQARFYNIRGVALDATNNILYISDYSNQRIRKINLTTRTTSLVAGSTSAYREGVGSDAQFSSPYSLALDSINQVLYVSDSSNYRIRKIDLTTNTTSLVAGSTNGNTDGIGSSVQFSSIYGLGLDQTNQILYAADYNNHKIRKIDLASKKVSTFGPQTIYIYGLTFDATNNLLYYTQSNGGSYHSVGKLDVKTTLTYPVTGGTTYGYIEGAGNTSRFYSPTSITIDPVNNQLYIADTNNNRIRKIDINHYKTPSFVSAYQYATDTAGSAIVAGGTTSINNVRFNFTFKDDDTFDTDKIELEIKPIGQAFDGTSNLVYSRNDTVTGTNYTKDIFIGDPILNYNTSYHWQYRITDLANFTSGWASFGGNTESAADFSIGAPENSKTTSWYSNTTDNNTPQAVLYTTGGVYVAYNYCVRKFPIGYSKELLSGDNSGTLVAGDCKSSGYMEGVTDQARFSGIRGIAIDVTNDLLYVSDYGNHRIRKVKLTTGMTSLVVGSSAAYREGIGSDAQFYYPTAIVLDSVNQMLYISDSSNFKIRKIDLTTNTTSLVAGSTQGYVDGVGTVAQFYNLGNGLALDSVTQTLYVTEYYNYSNIRKIDLASQRVSLFTSAVNPYGITFDPINNFIYYTTSWSSSSHQIKKIDVQTRTTVTIAGANTNGYAEGTANTSQFYSPNSIALDPVNNQLYIADTNNNRIRKVDINSYQNPAISSLQVKNIEDDSIALGATLKNRGLKLQYAFRDLDGTDFLQAEIEIKKVDQAFDGSGTYTSPGSFTVNGTDTTKNYIFNFQDVELGTSYHLRARAKDISGKISPWVYYGGNQDVGVSGALISDIDFSTPASDTASFQTKYIAGNGSFLYNFTNSLKAHNLALYSPRAIERDNVGNIYYVETDQINNSSQIKKIDPDGQVTLLGILGTSVNSITLDKVNGFLYIADAYYIYRTDIDGTSTTPLKITGNGVGYVEGYPIEAKFNNIQRITISSDNLALYIADQSNNRIRRLNLDASAPDYLSTYLVVGSGIAGNTEGTYLGASISAPTTMDFWTDNATNKKYLFVGNNGYIYRIDLAASTSTFFRKSFGNVSHIAIDSTGDYMYTYDSSYGLRKLSTTKNNIGENTIISAGIYSEGIGGSTAFYANPITGLVESGNNLYFIEANARIRSMKVPKAKDGTQPIIPLSVSQKESDQSTSVAVSGITKSQSMYLGVNMRHVYKYTHIRPEIEIKPLGTDFNAVYDPANTTVGPYQFYVGSDILTYVLITKDILKPSTAYHWRSRVIDVYGNTSTWSYANSNPESQSDFETGPVGIGQTNIVMGTLSAQDATGNYPLVLLPSFNNSLTQKDASRNILKVYFTDAGCLKYFDYTNYRNKNVSTFIQTVSCDNSFNSVVGPMKFNATQTDIYYYSSTLVYKYNIASNTATQIAGRNGGYTNGLPTSSDFNGIKDIVILRDINASYDEKCMLVLDNGNAKIRIVPLAGPGNNCKGVIGADNGYVEDWLNISGLTCSYQNNDKNLLYVNGGKISLADRTYTAISGMPCINSTLSADESFQYNFNSSNYNLYQTFLSTPSTPTKISGASTNGYLEGDASNARFSSVNTILYDSSFNSLYVNDNGKFREVLLNAINPPTLSGLSATTGKTGDSIAINGLNFGADPGYANRSNTMYGVLLNGTQIAIDDFVSWSGSTIVIRVPAGASTGDIRVKNSAGMSNGITFTVTNAPAISYIQPTAVKAGGAIQIMGKYFNAKNSSSFVQFTSASGGFIPATIVGWSDTRIDAYVPNNAITGKMKVQTSYGDSNLMDFTLVLGNPPNKPVPSSPINGATNQPLTPTLTTNPFFDIDGDTHVASWWELRESTQTFANPVFTTGRDTSSLISVSVPNNGMKPNTTYFWHVKFQDSRGDWSDWSDQIQFKTTDGGSVSGNLPPVRPSAISPANNTIDIDPAATLVLQASAYQDGETAQAISGATAQESSSWQVREFSSTYGNAIYQKLVSTPSFTTITLPANLFEGNKTYCWQVTYRDLGGSTSAFSTESCFRTKGSTTTGGSTTGNSSGGSYSLQAYDAPLAPSNFSLSNNTSAHLTTVSSNAYVDSNTDTLTGANDKLQAVEWQVLLFSGSTSVGLVTDSNGFVTDSRTASVSFGTAKKFRTLREDCSDDNCILSKTITYNDLGSVGTYLVRVRHMDQYSMWGDFSSVKTFEVTSLPNSAYLGKTRSIANLSVKTISGDATPFSYTWVGTTQAGAGGIIATSNGQCGGQTIPAMYSVYPYCLYDSSTSTIYGYISGIKSDSLKFEPTKKGTYNFSVTVTNPTTLKSLSKIIPVTVQ